MSWAASLSRVHLVTRELAPIRHGYGAVTGAAPAPSSASSDVMSRGSVFMAREPSG